MRSLTSSRDSTIPAPAPTKLNLSTPPQWPRQMRTLRRKRRSLGSSEQLHSLRKIVILRMGGLPCVLTSTGNPDEGSRVCFVWVEVYELVTPPLPRPVY